METNRKNRLRPNMFKISWLNVLHLILKRADAARAALDKAREEEYKKRVGICGVRLDLMLTGVV